MTKPTEEYTEEFVSVKDLEIDPRVQRQVLNRNKVADLVKNWNPGAVGLIHASRRKSRALILLDGWHRREAASIVSEGEGKLWTRIFTGLTLAQEAQMFLDLNRTNAPSLMDKFQVLLQGETSESAAAQDIAKILGEYGWKIARTAGPGHVNCVKVVQRIYAESELKNREPNILQLAILAITDAWGTTDRDAVNGSLVEAVAAIFDEYGDLLDTGRLINIMKETDGGPTGLLSRASQFAKLRKGRRSMATAYLIMEDYNKGLSRRGLGTWRRK